MTQSNASSKGKLFLIPSSLGTESVDHILPIYNKEVINSLRTFIVEDARTARRFLRDAGYTHSLDELNFHLLNKHTAIEDIPAFLATTQTGENIGLLSEAGCPCIADPGALVVALAHQKNIEVIPLVGPSSLMLALMASGFNGQNFAFNGYLPIDAKERSNKLKKLEQRAITENQTQLFIETPFRNNKLFDEILQILKPTTLLCVAANLTLPHQHIQTLTVQEWRKQKPELNKIPTVFLIYS